MVVKIHSPKQTPRGNNKGSSLAVFEYLSKEDEAKKEEEKTHFFNHSSDEIKIDETVNSIDSNKGKLGKDEYKFYMVTINFSQSEQKCMLKNSVIRPDDLSKEELKTYEKNIKKYTRSVMDNYAKSFNKNLRGDDLVYSAKIEHQRKFTYQDKEVKEGTYKRGTNKQGFQTHVHIIVSRYDKFQKKKISPLDKSRAEKDNHVLNNRRVQRGFNQLFFREENEKSFDTMFSYKRRDNEKIANILKYKKELKNQENNLSKLNNNINYHSLNPIVQTELVRMQERTDTSVLVNSELSKQNPIVNFINKEKETITESLMYLK